MALAVKAAFSAGEIDPALYERTTLDKYRNGLATARNVVVSEIGTLLSRPGRSYFTQCKLDNSPVICYSPPGSGLLLELGDSYMRIYSLSSGSLIGEVMTIIPGSDLENIHFETSGTFVYFFRSGQQIQKWNYISGFFDASNGVFLLPAAPLSGNATGVGAPTGYKVEYAFTYIINGQESQPLVGNGNINLPIAAGQSNTCAAALVAGTSVATSGISEMRTYRRPTGAGIYGFIGSATGTALTFGSGLISGTFTDLGQDADYTHSPPELITTGDIDPINLLSNTGIVYQQRLLITDSQTDLEAIYASQPGYQNNLTTNFPVDDASALKFKSGTSGYARVLRMLDDDGLIVFTTAGIYLNQGPLEPDNLAFAKKGKGVINVGIPPLSVPGGSFYVDVSTNAIRSLSFDFATQKYIEPDISVYSKHLFRTRQISTWGFQQGVLPLLWVVFNDGIYASFTFDFDQQMKAWTRHDSSTVLVRSCATTINPDQSFFVVSKVVNGVTKRYIELTIPRYVPPATIAIDPESDKNPSIAYMDSVVSFRNLLNDSLLGTDLFQLSPTSAAQDWSLPLNLTCGTSGIFGNLNTPFINNGNLLIGTIFRYFDSDGSIFDLEVTQLVDNNTVIVQPNTTFPSAAAIGARLYNTTPTFHNLSHMEGENVAVIVDGAVLASPNNDDQVYPIVTVLNGSITLPQGLVGALVHIGRPITADIETLDIDTVEQSPTLIESLNVNKLYIKVNNSNGLYVANKFPVDKNVQGMQSIDSYDVDYNQDNPIIGNRAQPSQTKRIEVTLPGDWKSQGKICIRQVDPLHFEILSIIPDCEILNRSDR